MAKERPTHLLQICVKTLQGLTQAKNVAFCFDGAGEFPGVNQHPFLFLIKV